MKTRKDLEADTDPLFLRFGSMIRRMAISVTAKALWQLTGGRQPDGTIETRTVELFPGIGFYSRPPSNGAPEAIVNNTFDAKSPAIVATRDEKTRAAVAGNLAQDETMLFNSKAVVYAKASGVVEVRAPNGVAVPLATKDDVTALANFVQAMTLAVSGGTAGPPTAGTVPMPAGTTVLKGA